MAQAHQVRALEVDHPLVPLVEALGEPGDDAVGRIAGREPRRLGGRAGGERVAGIDRLAVGQGADADERAADLAVVLHRQAQHRVEHQQRVDHDVRVAVRLGEGAVGIERVEAQRQGGEEQRVGERDGAAPVVRAHLADLEILVEPALGPELGPLAEILRHRASSPSSAVWPITTPAAERGIGRYACAPSGIGWPAIGSSGRERIHHAAPSPIARRLAAGLMAAFCLCAGASSAASESGKEQMLRSPGSRSRPLIRREDGGVAKAPTAHADTEGAQRQAVDLVCGSGRVQLPLLWRCDRAGGLSAGKLDSQTPDEGTSPSANGESMNQQAATRAEFGWGAFGEDGLGPALIPRN